MTDILQHFDDLKIRYRKIFQEELANFDENAENRILNLREKIFEKRNDYECGRCASCCKLAATPYSYDELKELASQGDSYATQFISVFIPYEDENVIKEIYPDYFETLEISDERINFYHCKFLERGSNICPRYEDRPQICRDFPDNPIDILPKLCNFNKWRDSVIGDVLRLRAITELLNLEQENT